MKKLNKFFAILVSLAMMATLCVMSAFAADPIDGQETDPTKAYLVKYLEIDSGVTIPEKTFYFKFTPSYDSSHAALTGEGADIPAIALVSISTSEMAASGLTTDGNSQVGAKKLADFLPAQWPHAGEFRYTVTETDAEGNALQNDDNWTYDDQSYVLHVYAKNDGDKAVLDKVTVENPTDGSKENPNTQDPTDDDDQDHATETDKTNGFTFDNQYKKTGPEIQPDPDDPSSGKYGAFGVAKSVENGDKTAAFPFTITLANTNDKNADQITAYIYTGTEQGDPITLSLNGDTTFDLTDGQSLVIPNLPDGTTAKVKERLTAATIQDKGSYTPDIVVKDNGQTNADAGVASAAANKGKDIEMATTIEIKDNDTGANVADVTNTRDDITPTGILMNNLPYIVLALVAIGGLVAYVVVRRRQSDEA